MSCDPSMDSSSVNTGSKSPINEGFTCGGDIVLLSLDGVKFSVHSILLSLASPVFADMLAVGTRAQENIITVGESSELLAITLKLIYPQPPPLVSSFDQLDQLLHVADKYQLSAMRERLLDQMSPGARKSLVSISSNPFRAFLVAASHGLQTETNAAISLATRDASFPSASELVQISAAIPSAISLIKLIGSSFCKTRVLAEVLFNFHQGPMQLNDDNCSWKLCSFCREMYLDGEQYSAPEWLARWAFAAFNDLRCLPLGEWDPIFTIQYFNSALHRDAYMPIELPRSLGRCTCPELINASRGLFEEWLDDVHIALVSRLEGLEQLE